MNMQFGFCSHCGQIMASVKSIRTVQCCGDSVQELIPGGSDAQPELHRPVYEICDGRIKVAVGALAHPMTEEHHIEWIILQTKNGIESRKLSPGSKPECSFMTEDDNTVEAVYAFCNLHGLWKE